jgi:capsular polysaccharide biosynthesis protein
VSEPAAEPFLEEPIDGRGYFEILWRSRSFLAALIIGSTVAAFGLSLLIPKTYEATARVLFDNSADPLVPSDAESVARQLATAQRLAMTPDVLAVAARDVAGESGMSLEEKVTVTADSDANLLNVTASSHDPNRAAAIANAVAITFVEDQRASIEENIARAQAILRSRLETLGTSSADEVERTALTEELSSLELRAATANLRFRVVEQAEPPDEPASPHPMRNALAAFFASTVIGVLLVLGRAQLGSRFTDARQLSRFLNIPILARVSLPPNRGRSSDGRAVALESAAFSALRGRAERILDPASKHVVLVTSPVAGSGSPEVSAALARALAETDRPTLLVLAVGENGISRRDSSGEDRHTLVERSTQTTGSEDASSLLPRLGPRRAVQSSMNSRLFIVDGSQPWRNAAGEVRNEEQAREMTTAAKQNHTYVVIEAPPLLATNDTLILAEETNELVVVAELNRVTRSQMLDTRDLLHEIGKPVLGLVLIEEGTRPGSRRRRALPSRSREDGTDPVESAFSSENGVPSPWWRETARTEGTSTESAPPLTTGPDRVV